MELPAYPSPDVLLARLVRSHGAGVPKGDGVSEEEFLSRLAERVGSRSQDLFLIAGLSIPDEELRFDEAAGREVPKLVLGVSAGGLVSLTGMRHTAESPAQPAEIVGTAGLIWDVRQLTANQVRQVSQLAI